MKKFILILGSFLLFSCGARKVDKREELHTVKTDSSYIIKKDLTVNTNTKIETRIFTNDSTKEEIEEINYSPIDRNKPAIFTDELGNKRELNNISFTKRKIKRNKALKTESNIITSEDKKSVDRSKESGNLKKRKEDYSFEKHTFRESFQWYWIIFIILLLCAAYYYIKKRVSI